MERKGAEQRTWQLGAEIVTGEMWSISTLSRAPREDEMQKCCHYNWTQQ